MGSPYFDTYPYGLHRVNLTPVWHRYLFLPRYGRGAGSIRWCRTAPTASWHIRRSARSDEPSHGPQQRPQGHLGPPVVPFYHFLEEGSPTQISIFWRRVPLLKYPFSGGGFPYSNTTEKKGTLILTSQLEDLGNLYFCGCVSF